MKILPFALILVAVSCSPFAANSAAESTGALPELTHVQKTAIGRKIWQNECGGSFDGLTTWNVGEEFPSLGIGHFIWYTSSHKGPFTETWPLLMRYCKERGVTPPAIALSPHSPWNSPAEFKKEFRSPRMNELRQWLGSTVTLQTEFIIARSRAALPKILAGAPASDRARIAANYQKVATTAHGQYALIDYVNFKGDGLNPTERYRGKGWGLLQVLGGMKEVSSGPAAASEFAASATRALNQRIDNSPPARGEARWRAGWNNRCQTYARPL
ncbi:MAG: hypothetical protein RI957_183 [Verrucomicrobiota bacterium]|jgi:hypothetical protein